LTTLENRCVGLEQEFFLVDEYGVLSNRADEFLAWCQEVAEATGRDPESYAPECARSMVEINTPPVYSLEELSHEYLANLELALDAGRELGLRLYPLATYPLHVEPVMRDEPHYQIQARAVGRERFLHAGRCAGMHLHLEVERGTVNSRVGVSYGSGKAAREELLNLYNLATAFDAALIALTRSCPFYEGIADGTAARTALYRGDPYLAPHGLYTRLQEVGGLLPSATSAGCWTLSKPCPREGTRRETLGRRSGAPSSRTAIYPKRMGRLQKKMGLRPRTSRLHLKEAEEASEGRN